MEALGISSTDLVFIIIGVIILSSSLTFLKKLPKIIGYIAIMVGVVFVMRGVITLETIEPYFNEVVNFLVNVANKLAETLTGILGSGPEL